MRMIVAILEQSPISFDVQSPLSIWNNRNHRFFDFVLCSSRFSILKNILLACLFSLLIVRYLPKHVQLYKQTTHKWKEGGSEHWNHLHTRIEYMYLIIMHAHEKSSIDKFKETLIFFPKDTTKHKSIHHQFYQLPVASY